MTSTENREQQNSGRPHQPPPHQRFTAINITLALFLVAVVWSVLTLKGPGRDIDYVRNLLRFAGHFFPPDFSVVPTTFHALVETFKIAVLSTFISVYIAIPVAMASARTISPGWVVWSTRMLMNIIRTIPSLIWALIAVAVAGPNALAGVIALTFYSLGYLGKFFADAFESVDVNVSRSLRLMGAHPIQAFQYGLWPGAKPLIWSHSLWMLEYNLRSASIIGYVGAGGIGVQLYTYQEHYEWRKFATVLISILVLVTVLDMVGEKIRAKTTPVRSKSS